MMQTMAVNMKTCIICGTCFTFVFNTDIRRHLCRVNLGGPNWRQPCSISYNHNQRIAVRCNALTFLIILVAFLGVPTQSVDTKVVKNAWEKSLFVCLQTETLNTCSCCCTHMQKESVACEATLNPVLVYQVQTHLWAQPQDFHSCFFFIFCFFIQIFLTLYWSVDRLLSFLFSDSKTETITIYCFWV